MGRKPSKLVDAVELELLMGHDSFEAFRVAVEAAVGPMNTASLRVYWHYHRKHGPLWRKVMRGEAWLRGSSSKAGRSKREDA